MIISHSLAAMLDLICKHAMKYSDMTSFTLWKFLHSGLTDWLTDLVGYSWSMMLLMFLLRVLFLFNNLKQILKKNEWNSTAKQVESKSLRLRKVWTLTRLNTCPSVRAYISSINMVVNNQSFFLDMKLYFFRVAFLIVCSQRRFSTSIPSDDIWNRLSLWLFIFCHSDGWSD